mgnify:CR=1 FL=1
MSNSSTGPSEGKPDLGFLDDLADALRHAQQGLDAYNKAAFPSWPPEFFALELSGEAGELANNEKKIWKGRRIAHETLADEAADVLIALVNYANSRDIDLASAFSDKMREIERRRLAGE